MISKAKIKYLTSLSHKKHHQKEQLFVAEGPKIVSEVLQQSKFQVKHLYASKLWIDKNIPIYNKYYSLTTLIEPNELKKISSLKNPKEVFAVLQMPSQTSELSLQSDIALALENIQDPGNMGTILRIADWFGIKSIFCSEACVDLYNSKVIQASMGSFLRVQVQYSPLETVFEQHPSIPVYGAVLGGESLFETALKKPAIVLIGNEGKGISHPLQQQINHRLTIPKTGAAESLNAAVATGIICAMFRQQC
jgi:TrmH family RNA methyltransferase